MVRQSTCFVLDLQPDLPVLESIWRLQQVQEVALETNDQLQQVVQWLRKPAVLLENILKLQEDQ